MSFSGGKDSTVLLHLVRSIFPDVKAVFSNTGLEYPEIQKHVMSIENVDVIRPSMRFDEVISTYGYPLIGKEVAEAIYYARRIRSQNSNVEREREPEKQQQSTTGNGASMWGVLEGTESGRDSESHRTARYSHPDEHCKEQTNGLNGKVGDAEGIGDRAGVAEPNLNIGGGYFETQRRRDNLHPQWERTRIGTVTNRARESGSNCTDSNQRGGTPQTGDQRETQPQRDSQQIPKSRGSTDWTNWRRGCL